MVSVCSSVRRRGGGDDLAQKQAKGKIGNVQQIHSVKTGQCATY